LGSGLLSDSDRSSRLAGIAFVLSMIWPAMIPAHVYEVSSRSNQH
jgi:hypothetical protein